MNEVKSTTSPALKESELADLMRVVTEVTTRLEATHEQLRAEVARQASAGSRYQFAPVQPVRAVDPMRRARPTDGPAFGRLAR